MPKIVKTLLITVVSLVALVAVGLAAVVMLVNPNDFKPQIIELVEKQTGRLLSIEQPLELTVFPSIGLSTGDVRLSNAKGFAETNFAQFDQLVLRVKLMPLLKQQLEADTVVLRGMRLNLERKANGQTNWDDLVAKSSGEAPAKSSDAAVVPAALVIEGVDIDDAQITWVDQMAGERLTITQMSLQSSGIKAGQSTDVSASLQLQSALYKLTANVSLGGQIKAAADPSKLVVSPLTLKASAKGDALPRQGLSVDLKTNLAVDLPNQSVRLEKLQGDALGMQIAADLSATSKEAIQVKGGLTLSTDSLRGVLEALGITLQTADATVMGPFRLTAEAQQFGQTISLDKLDLSLDDLRVNGSAQLVQGKVPSVSAKVSMNALNVDLYMPSASDKPSAKQTADSANPLGALFMANVDAELKISELIAQKVKMTDVLVEAKSKDKQLRVYPMKAKLYGGDFSGDIKIDARKKEPFIQAKKVLRNVQLGPMLNDRMNFDKLVGLGDIEADMSVRGLDEAAIRNSLNGTASFNFRDGAVKGVNIAKLIRQAGALLGVKSAGEVSDQNQTDFTSLSGSIKAINGVVSNSDLSAMSPLLRVSGKGSVKLPKDTVDYRLAVELVSSLQGQGGQAADQLSGIPVPVRIVGPLQKPQFKPELDSVLKSKAEQELKKKAKEKLDEKLKGVLGDQLKGLFGR
jgi:AsmA protein